MDDVDRDVVGRDERERQDHPLRGQIQWTEQQKREGEQASVTAAMPPKYTVSAWASVQRCSASVQADGIAPPPRAAHARRR